MKSIANESTVSHHGRVASHHLPLFVLLPALSPCPRFLVFWFSRALCLPPFLFRSWGSFWLRCAARAVFAKFPALLLGLRFATYRLGACTLPFLPFLRSDEITTIKTAFPFQSSHLDAIRALYPFWTTCVGLRVVLEFVGGTL